MYTHWCKRSQAPRHFPSQLSVLADSLCDQLSIDVLDGLCTCPFIMVAVHCAHANWPFELDGLEPIIPLSRSTTLNQGAQKQANSVRMM
jgi:hypothetical protein